MDVSLPIRFLKANLEKLLNNLPSIPVATRMSSTSRETQQENIPAFILVDSAYPSTSRIVPTFKNNECNRNRDIKKLNAKLAGIRYYLENAFGICKGRFRLLNRAIECAKQDVIRASFLITAIFVLHNFLIDENDDTPIDAEPDAVDDANLNEYVSDDDEGDDNEHECTRTRDMLLRHIYCLNTSWTRGST